MQYTLIRSIYFQSPGTGLVKKIVAKDIESDIPPMVGYQYEDSAWHRDDLPKAESVVINTNSRICTVELAPVLVEKAEYVEKMFKVVLSHEGWRDWLRS